MGFWDSDGGGSRRFIIHLLDLIIHYSFNNYIISFYLMMIILFVLLVLVVLESVFGVPVQYPQYQQGQGHPVHQQGQLGPGQLSQFDQYRYPNEQQLYQQNSRDVNVVTGYPMNPILPVHSMNPMHAYGQPHQSQAQTQTYNQFPNQGHQGHPVHAYNQFPNPNPSLYPQQYHAYQYPNQNHASDHAPPYQLHRFDALSQQSFARSAHPARSLEERSVVESSGPPQGLQGQQRPQNIQNTDYDDDEEEVLTPRRSRAFNKNGDDGIEDMDEDDGEEEVTSPEIGLLKPVSPTLDRDDIDEDGQAVNVLPRLRIPAAVDPFIDPQNSDYNSDNINEVEEGREWRYEPSSPFYEPTSPSYSPSWSEFVNNDHAISPSPFHIDHNTGGTHTGPDKQHQGGDGVLNALISEAKRKRDGALELMNPRQPDLLMHIKDTWTQYLFKIEHLAKQFPFSSLPPGVGEGVMTMEDVVEEAREGQFRAISAYNLHSIDEFDGHYPASHELDRWRHLKLVLDNPVLDAQFQPSKTRNSDMDLSKMNTRRGRGMRVKRFVVITGYSTEWKRESMKSLLETGLKRRQVPFRNPNRGRVEVDLIRPEYLWALRGVVDDVIKRRVRQLQSRHSQYQQNSQYPQAQGNSRRSAFTI